MRSHPVMGNLSHLPNDRRTETTLPSRGSAGLVPSVLMGLHVTGTRAGAAMGRFVLGGRPGCHQRAPAASPCGVRHSQEGLRRRGLTRRQVTGFGVRTAGSKGQPGASAASHRNFSPLCPDLQAEQNRTSGREHAPSRVQSFPPAQGQDVRELAKIIFRKFRSSRVRRAASVTSWSRPSCQARSLRQGSWASASIFRAWSSRAALSTAKPS